VLAALRADLGEVGADFGQDFRLRHELERRITQLDTDADVASLAIHPLGTDDAVAELVLDIADELQSFANAAVVTRRLATVR
jgi:hypothetical protein